MRESDIHAVIDQLDDQIVLLVKDFVKRRRNEYETAVIRLKEDLRTDVIKYTKLLDERKINLEDYEFLIKGRAAQLKIEILAESSISKSKFNLLSDEMISLMLKGLILVITVL